MPAERRFNVVRAVFAGVVLWGISTRFKFEWAVVLKRRSDGLVIVARWSTSKKLAQKAARALADHLRFEVWLVPVSHRGENLTAQTADTIYGKAWRSAWRTATARLRH